MSQQLSPYENYEFLRRSGELHWTGRTWLATHYAVVAEGLTHEQLSARRVDQLFGSKELVARYPILAEALKSWTFFSDPTDVKMERLFIWEQLGPKSLGEIPDIVTRVTRSSLAARSSKGLFDVRECLTKPLRMTIVRCFLELPEVTESDLQQALQEADCIFEFITSSQPSESQMKKAQDAILILKSVLQLSGLVGKSSLESGRVINQLILLAVVSIFIEKAILNVIAAFATTDGLWLRIRSDRSTIGVAVTEALRLESPTQITSRIAQADFEWRGQSIKRGDPVALVIGSANRDEVVFRDAAKFDEKREGPKPLTYGIGGKRCPGEWLTNTVLEKVFVVWADEGIDLRILHQGIEWLVNPESRRPTKLLLEF